jgi:hypothetical protein
MGVEPLSFLNSPFLQIGNISLPRAAFWTFCIGSDSDEECFRSWSGEVMSVIVSVPSLNNYNVKVMSDCMTGFLETTTGVSTFEVGSNLSFFEDAHFVASNIATATAAQTALSTATFTVSLQKLFRPRKICMIGFG